MGRHRGSGRMAPGPCHRAGRPCRCLRARVPLDLSEPVRTAARLAHGRSGPLHAPRLPAFRRSPVDRTGARRVGRGGHAQRAAVAGLHGDDRSTGPGGRPRAGPAVGTLAPSTRRGGGRPVVDPAPHRRRDRGVGRRLSHSGGPHRHRGDHSRAWPTSAKWAPTSTARSPACCGPASRISWRGQTVLRLRRHVLPHLWEVAGPRQRGRRPRPPHAASRRCLSTTCASPTSPRCGPAHWSPTFSARSGRTWSRSNRYSVPTPSATPAHEDQMSSSGGSTAGSFTASTPARSP